MRFHVMPFRFFRAARADPPGSTTAGGEVPAADLPPPLPPLPPLAAGEWGIGHPTVESQRAGLEHLIGITLEQAAARRRSQAARSGTADDRDRTSVPYRHS